MTNRGFDLDGAVAEKRAYNADREDHKPENRKKEGGMSKTYRQRQKVRDPVNPYAGPPKAELRKQVEAAMASGVPVTRCPAEKKTGRKPRRPRAPSIPNVTPL